MSSQAKRTATYGIGVEGGLGPALVGRLAQIAESVGYTSFWFNATPPLTDPGAVLGEALDRTTSIDVGVGVLPVDAYPPAALEVIAREAAAHRNRTIIGIGSGQIKTGALRQVELAVLALRRASSDVRIAIGAYGPRMLTLAAQMADAVVANWLTLDRLTWVREQLERSARSAGRQMPIVFLYHRAAAGSGAAARIEEEMRSYQRFPVHRRHQAAMGFPRMIGIAIEAPQELPALLEPYARLCVPVLRPLPADRANIGEWESLLQFFSPSSLSTVD